MPGMKVRWAPLCVGLFATVSVAIAQPPKKPEPTNAPPSPTGTGAGTADAPPAPDAEGPPPARDGTSEDPGAPRPLGVEEKPQVVAVPEKKPESGYPIEEAARPINLPAGMAEVAIGPRFMASVPEGAPFGPSTMDIGYVGSDALRARYGITRQVQLGFTYVLGGIYDDPRTASDKLGFHPGKAIGLDVQYLVRDWVGVKVGVPVWIYRPEEGGAPAIGLTIGTPIKFRFGRKLALGGLDDLLAIKITRFAPSFEHEYLNAYRAALDDIGTPGPAGFLRLAGYAVYQQSPKLALIGRVGITFEDFTSTKTQSDRGGGSATFIRGGLEYTVRKYLDVGVSAGFEDLSALGTFGLTTLLAFRI